MNAAKIVKARAETVELLNKALAYSPEFQKPAQIKFYREHIEYLDALAAGNADAPKPKADLQNWDVMACTIAWKEGAK